jgi:hypothetical protein
MYVCLCVCVYALKNFTNIVTILCVCICVCVLMCVLCVRALTNHNGSPRLGILRADIPTDVFPHFYSELHASRAEIRIQNI